jgi:hypothetical protein
MTRAVAISPLGLLCNRPPWGELVAVDLKAGKILWRSSVGTSEDRAPLGIAFNWGTPLVNVRRDHGGWAGFHRRDGCLLARVRRQNRRRTLVFALALAVVLTVVALWRWRRRGKLRRRVRDGAMN